MPEYIVPSLINADNVSALIVPALFEAEPDFWQDLAESLPESQHIGCASVDAWSRYPLTGHQSQTFVPMACEAGEFDPLTNTAPSRYLIPNVTVTFQTWDGLGVCDGGLFEVRRIRPDGAVEEFWVDVADLLV